MRLLPEHLERLPVFPLRSVVLFPHTLVPLHIFEARYRRMIEDVLAAERPFAIAMPVAGSEGQDAPALQPVLGVGWVERDELLPDGRRNIVVQGAWRARIIEELPLERPYREVRAELLREDVRDFAPVAELMNTLRGCVMGIRSLRPELACALARMSEREAPPSVVADRLAAMLFPDPQERQQLLEELCMERRLARVVDRLTEFLTHLGGEGGALPN